MKALFVDLDGTLADTVPQLYAIYCDILRPYAGSKKEFQELNGKTLQQIAAYLEKKYGLPADSFARHEAAVDTLYATVPLFPYARETLETMQERGVKCLLVTSATEKLALHFLRSHRLEKLFETVVTAEGIPGKPSPAIYKRALQLAGVDADKGVALEDSENGAAASTGAGIFTLILEAGCEKKREKLSLKVPSWQEIARELDGLSDL